jgi:hypothetical protein
VDPGEHEPVLVGLAWAAALMIPSGAITMIAASAPSWPRPVSHGLMPKASFSRVIRSVTNNRSGLSRPSQIRA